MVGLLCLCHLMLLIDVSSDPEHLRDELLLDVEADPIGSEPPSLCPQVPLLGGEVWTV